MSKSQSLSSFCKGDIKTEKKNKEKKNEKRKKQKGKKVVVD